MKLSEIAAIIEQYSPYELQAVSRLRDLNIATIGRHDENGELHTVSIALSELDLNEGFEPHIMVQIRTRHAVENLRRHLGQAIAACSA